MVGNAAAAGSAPRAPVLFMIYLFFARWWRRLAPAPRLPIYSAGPTPSPAPASDDDVGALPAPSDDTLSPSKYKMLARVEKYCLDYGVCTASNETLAKDWKGRGRPCTTKHVRRLLLELARDGRLEGWFEPRHCSPENPTGRAIRVCNPAVPHRQLELRMGQRRRATPEEFARGYPAAAPPAPERRGDPSTPERRSGGHDPRTSMSAGHVRPGGVDMSTDPRSEIGTPKGTVSETGPGPAQAAPGLGNARSNASAKTTAASATRGAASTGATDSTTARLRLHAAEMGRRRDTPGLKRLWHELHAGADSCARCKQLDGQPERDLVPGGRGERVAVGLLFPTLEAAEEAARGHTELHPAPPPEEAAADEDAEDVYEAEATPGAHGKVRIVERDGAPAYYHADSNTWVPLDEEGVGRAVRLGWAVDERPPRGAPPPRAGRERPPDPGPLDLDVVFLDEAELFADEIGAGAGP